MIYNYISLVFRLHVLIDKQSDKYNCMAVFFVQHVDYEVAKLGLLVSTHRMGTFCDLLCVKETCSVKYCCVDLLLTRFAHIGIISCVRNHLFSPQVSGLIPQTQVHKMLPELLVKAKPFLVIDQRWGSVPRKEPWWPGAQCRVQTSSGDKMVHPEYHTALVGLLWVT